MKSRVYVPIFLHRDHASNVIKLVALLPKLVSSYILNAMKMLPVHIFCTLYSHHGILFSLCVRDNMFEGLSGNPNHMANCFPNLTGRNIAINGIRFWLGDYTPPPDTLNIRLWSGSTITGPDSNIPIYDESITGYDTGMNTFTLQTTTTPITITAGDEFCAGVYSGPVDDGFRISTEIGDGSVYTRRVMSITLHHFLIRRCRRVIKRFVLRHCLNMFQQVNKVFQFQERGQ